MPTFRDNLHLGTKDPLVDADSIADHSITNDKLACDSVGTCQIQDGAVTQEKTTGIMSEIYALRDKLNQRTAEREAADRDLQADVAALKRTSVKSVSVNSGTKVYPDANGNVNLPISIDGGGQPITPPDISELQNNVAALQSDVSDLRDATDALDELVSGEGGIDDRLSAVEGTAYTKHIPLGALLETSPTVEQTSLAVRTEGCLYSYVWDIQGSRLLLKVLDPHAPIGRDAGNDSKYYMSWNRLPTGTASDDIDLDRDFFYLSANDSLTIYKYKAISSTIGRLVATGSGSGGASILFVNATNARVGANGQYLFDCDRTNAAVYNHVAGGGIAIVKGSLGGNFQAILSGASFTDGTYCVTGVTEIGGNLFSLAIKNPINSAQSTLYASQPVNKAVSALDSRITDNENNISELFSELSNVKGSAKFIPLGAILTSSPAVSAETLAVKKSGCSYAYVWLKPLKKLLVQETANNVLPARVSYYDSWSEGILGTSSSDINPTDCFFYSFGDESMTIWHWKGSASTGDLVPAGADLTTVNNYLTEISDAIGTIPSDVNSIGDFISDVQSRVNDIEFNAGLLTDPANKDFVHLAAVMDEPVVQTGTLTSLSDNATYAYVWDKKDKRVLLRETKTIGIMPQVKLYAAWVLPDSGFIPSATFAAKKYDYFYYTTNDTLLTIWHWSPQAENIVPTNVEAQGGDEEGEPYVPFDPSEIEPMEPDDPGDDEDYSSNPSYPEYYGAQGDATEYYDWPLVCFGGIVNDNITIEGETSDIEVYAPGERIYYKYGMTEDYFGKSLDYCSDSVVYSSVNKKFVLKANNKYYDKWENSGAWNDPNTGKARTDTLYSDIEELAPSEKTSLDPNDEYGLCRRRTYIFRSNEMQDLFNQDSTKGTVFLHDDGPALYAWFEANKGTGREMRLAPDKVYYIASQQVVDGTPKRLGLAKEHASTMFACVSNTIVDGNGSTIFARMYSTGWPPKRSVPPNTEHSNAITIFHLNRCSNVVIRNIKFKSLRDKDANCPKGSNSRFSTSSSAVSAMSCGLVGSAYDKQGNPLIPKGTFQTSYITIEDIECKNISAPLGFAHGTNFVIKNVTATGVVSQGFGLAHSTYENIHMVMAPYIGSGMHLFYGGCYVDDVKVSGSSFKTVDPYTEVMVTLHGGNKYPGNAGSAPDSGKTAELSFENCVFEGGVQVFRGDKYSAGRLCVRLTGCIVKTQFNKQMGSLYYGYPKRWSSSTSQSDIDPKFGAVISPLASTWYISGGVMYIGDGTLTDYGTPRDGSLLSVKDTTIVSTRSTQGMRLIGCQATYDGQIEASNIKTNYPGPYGIASDAISPIDDEDEPSYPEYASAPTNPSAGDIYINTTDGRTYRCTQPGMATRIGVRIYVSSFPYSATHTVSFSNGETTHISINGAETAEEVADAIVSACVAAGYSDSTGIGGNIKGSTWKPGYVMKYPSGSVLYVMVTSKALGNFERSFSPDSTGTIHMQKVGSQAYQSGNGVDSTWIDITDTASNGTTAGGSGSGTEQQGQG